ncbi:MULTISPECIES: ABC transporter substrate-binding protein [unclassified Agrococcus]|uniref:ABC transporter substrate-binding protein n=1 Tax=unclassified Agrococcus TaxID=2615065 RepID=UPI00361BA88C
MRRARPVVAAAAALVLLTACGPSLPQSVVEGSEVAIGWQGELTSTNVASTAGATPGNVDVAAATRAQFASIGNDGALVANTDLGTVEIESDDPFTVRFDVADGVSWSDGVPLDAADLLLAWAAGSNALAPGGFDPEASVDDAGALVVPDDVAWFDVAEPGGLALAEGEPELDEFERRLDVTLSAPVEDWQTMLQLAVPAHVVGQRALGIDDPMEAKQAVLDAIRIADPEALAAIAAEWNDGFAIDADPDAALLVSSGPYVVADVDDGGVTLEPNRRYAGTTPTIESVELVSLPVDRLVTAVGSDVEAIEVEPTEENFVPIRDLTRNGFVLTAAQTGEIWTLQLRGDRGVLQSTLARQSLLHGIPRSDVIAAAGGQWAQSMGTTDVALFPTGSPGYQIALQDAGFAQRWGTSDAELSAIEREQAGVAAGTAICVVYDRTEPFAARAFQALAAGVAESGWAIADCGADDLDARIAEGGWDAVIAAVPLPTTAEEVAAQWGTGGSENLTGIGDPERDALIASSGTRTDPFLERDDLVAVETSIVAQGVVLPLSNVVVADVVAPGVEGVQPRNGPDARLTWQLEAWALE